MSTVVSFSRVRLSHGMQKWSAKLSNPGVIFEHVSRTSVRYLDDRGRHGTEMTVFLANFDSQTCTSGFAIIFLGQRACYAHLRSYIITPPWHGFHYKAVKPRVARQLSRTLLTVDMLRENHSRRIVYKT